MENNDSVAFIGKVNKILPIIGADKIEQVFINGWSSVSQKGSHNIDDLVLCITTNAVIPIELSTKWNIIQYLRKDVRVRTVKLKGVYSECVLISLKDIGLTKLRGEGHDLMIDLDIIKYQPPVRNINIPGDKTRKVRYQDNPNFHIYYKFPNQKNVPDMFNSDDIVVITRKIHGTNARYGIVKKLKLSILDRIKKLFGNKFIDYEFVYGSHNVEKGSDSQGFYSTDVWKEMIDKYDIKNKLWKLVKDSGPSIGKGIIIYGEIYGDGIQGKEYSYGLYCKDIKFFDVELNGEYQNDFYFKYLLLQDLEFPIVDELYRGNWYEEEQDKYVGGFINNTKIPHEGIVVKHISGDRKKLNKVINPEYLIFSEKNNIEDLEAH